MFPPQDIITACEFIPTQDYGKQIKPVVKKRGRIRIRPTEVKRESLCSCWRPPPPLSAARADVALPRITQRPVMGTTLT